MSRLRLHEIRDRVSALLPQTVRSALASLRPVVETKDNDLPGDVVTNLDLAIQSSLLPDLEALVPGSVVIAEEGFEDGTGAQSGLAWIVDPLDGTLNFASRLPFFGASVALCRDGMPVVGVVFDAASGTVYDAIRNEGARENGSILRFSPDLAARSPVAVSSGFLALLDTDNGREAVLDSRRTFPRFRILGSQSVQLCLAAAGRLRANVSVEARLWDDVAGALVCQEAGAAYSLVSGRPPFPLAMGSPGLDGSGLFSVAGAPDAVETLLRIIRQSMDQTP